MISFYQIIVVNNRLSFKSDYGGKTHLFESGCKDINFNIDRQVYNANLCNTCLLQLLFYNILILKHILLHNILSTF